MQQNTSLEANSRSATLEISPFTELESSLPWSQNLEIDLHCELDEHNPLPHTLFL
jgi:hypothetical protein